MREPENQTRPPGGLRRIVEMLVAPFTHSETAHAVREAMKGRRGIYRMPPWEFPDVPPSPDRRKQP